MVALTDVARRHAIAAVIEDAADQQGLGPRPCGLVIVYLFGQPVLDGIEQIAVDNGGLLARQDLALKSYFSNIEAVTQQVGERSAGERDAPATVFPVLSVRTSPCSARWGSTSSKPRRRVTTRSSARRRRRSRKPRAASWSRCSARCLPRQRSRSRPSAPTIPCGCICARWVRWSSCRERGRSPSPSASRPAARP